MPFNSVQLVPTLVVFKHTRPVELRRAPRIVRVTAIVALPHGQCTYVHYLLRHIRRTHVGLPSSVYTVDLYGEAFYIVNEYPYAGPEQTMA